MPCILYAQRYLSSRIYRPMQLLLKSCPARTSSPNLNLGSTTEEDYHMLFMAFKLNSTPTKVAAWISALVPVHIFAHSSLLRQGSLIKRENGNTHISRESPSHSWSETFPEGSNSIRSDQFSSTIEETGVCPLRGGLKS
jgi:hypothetical protein